MLISGIEKTKKGRYSVFVDGSFLYSVAEDTYVTTELATGADLTPERLEEIRLADETASAKEKALTLLECCDHSRGMLVQKLCRHYSREASEAAADRMQELGLTDDADYARRLAADMAALRGYPRARIRFELTKRGISREDTQAALDALPGEDETEVIGALLRKKYRAKLDTPEGIKKTVASLLRQGFSYEDVKTALRRAAGETDAAEHGEDNA